VEPWISWAENAGYDVDGAGDYRNAVAEVKRMKDDFPKHWPFIDEAEVSQGDIVNSCGWRFF
jgi:hypothetical protein